MVALAEEAARIFDEIVIRQDNDLRGRTEIEISSLLRTGVHRVDPHKKITYFSNEPDAIDYAVQSSLPDSLTVIFVDNVQSVCSRVEQHLDAHNKAKGALRPTG
jgi:cyanophycin synthetase